MADETEQENVQVEAQAPPVALMEIPTLVKYLQSTCPLLLDCTKDTDLQEFQRTLQSSETLDALKKFISDVNSPVLVVQKVDVSGKYFRFEHMYHQIYFFFVIKNLKNLILICTRNFLLSDIQISKFAFPFN